MNKTIILIIVSILLILTMVCVYFLNKNNDKKDSAKTTSFQARKKNKDNRLQSNLSYQTLIPEVQTVLKDNLKQEYQKYKAQVNKYSINNSQKTDNFYLPAPPPTEQIYTMPAFNDNFQSLQAISKQCNAM